MTYNLHTHSFYCRHGEGKIVQYVNEAERLGIEILGFSEHCPYPSRILEDNNSRMFYPEMESYEKDVREASKTSKIKVFLGYECDLWPGYDSYIESLKEKVDYLCAGVHFLPGVDGARFSAFDDTINIKGNLRIYVDAYIRAIDSGLFIFGAHPDVFLFKRKSWDSDAKAASKDILDAALEKNFPLEVNKNGIVKALRNNDSYTYGYPNDNFWDMAKDMGIRCVKNSDAHVVENLGLYNDRLEAFIEKHKLNMATVDVKNNKLCIL